MTSNINFAAINENFPVAGQDNDTQVFRDNFDTIKTALSVAKTEISDLQGEGDISQGAARREEDNDFNNNKITKAQLIFNTETIKPNGPGNPNFTDTIDYENGNYQIFTINNEPFTFDFLNFPKDGTTVGKVRVELYGSDTNEKTVNFTLSGSGATSVKSEGFPGYSSGLPVITLNSATTAIIFDVWRHTESTFFMHYIGSFS